MEARFKIDEWIEPYKVEGSQGFVSYHIPSYKLDRLKEIEQENVVLKELIKEAKLLAELYIDMPNDICHEFLKKLEKMEIK